MYGKNATIVVYTYPESVWGNKVLAYLDLRGIPYTICRQPMTWPREDLEQRLGIKYRRIPLMAVGRDFYFDTRLMLEKLETLFPGDNTLAAKVAGDRAFEKLSRDWAELAVFGSAVGSLPPELPTFQDDTFMKDRRELAGATFTREHQKKRRPGALTEMRTHFDLLEDLLSDGRQWALGTSTIGLTDLHVGFAIDWLFNIPQALPDNFFGPQLYPHTVAYAKRWRETINAAAKSNAGSVKTLPGEVATTAILNSPFAEDKLGVAPDPTELGEGAKVNVCRTDDASSPVRHIDAGSLVGLNTRELVISRSAGSSDVEIRLHYPRWKFAIVEARQTKM